jgi:DNA invertase Pin-like site-specific DNA recombinase
VSVKTTTPPGRKSKADIRRAAIYLRTTVKGSRRIPKKEAACRAYCEQKGWRVVEEFVVSEVASPSTLSRDGLQLLLSPEAAGSFDVLIVYEFGDLSKNAAQSEQIIGELAQLNIFLAIVHNPTLEERLAKLESRLPDGELKTLKSVLVNKVLRAGNRQN